MSKNKMTEKEESQFRKEASALILNLISAKNEAARLRLWRTMHGVDVATTAVGWEVADILTGKQARV